MSEYTLTVLNPNPWNEFEHRQVVFTRLASAGNGIDRPYSKKMQIWDAETDTLIIELTLTDSIDT